MARGYDTCFGGAREKAPEAAAAGETAPLVAAWADREPSSEVESGLRYFLVGTYVS